MSTLLARALAATRLETAVYDELPHDPRALGQSLAVFLAASIGSGFGMSTDASAASAAISVAASALGSLAWLGTVYAFATRRRSRTGPVPPWDDVLCATGFATAPGVAGLAALVPALGGAVLPIVAVWQFAAAVVAVRHVFAYASRRPVLVVCAIGVVAQMAVVAAITATAAAARGHSG